MRAETNAGVQAEMEPRIGTPGGAMTAIAAAFRRRDETKDCDLWRRNDIGTRADAVYGEMKPGRGI